MFAILLWKTICNQLTDIAFNVKKESNENLLYGLLKIFSQYEYEELGEMADKVAVAITTFKYNKEKRWRISKEEFIQWYGKIEDGAFLQ